MSRSTQIQVLDTTSKCGQYLLPFFHGEREEVVYLLCLDAKCKALDCVLIHRGGVNVASIAARKVVKAALDSNATSVVLAHNHPSGLALPSQEDKQTTMVLKAALDAVGVVLADHIIVADDDFVSMRRRRQFPEGTYGLSDCIRNSSPPATSRRRSTKLVAGDCKRGSASRRCSA